MEKLNISGGIIPYTRVSVSPYAQAVMKEYNISYIGGVLNMPGGKIIDLRGGKESPNYECMLGGKELRPVLVANCTEAVQRGGRVLKGEIKYLLNIKTPSEGQVSIDIQEEK